MVPDARVQIIIFQPGEGVVPVHAYPVSYSGLLPDKLPARGRLKRFFGLDPGY
jgi:hypothetical protein